MKRLLVGVIVAWCLSSAGILAQEVKAATKLPKPKPQSALCASFEPWSAPWIFFGCMFEPKDGDPRT